MMSWISLAIGLIREAATTEVGRDIINDLRSNVSGKRRPPPDRPEEVNEWRQSVEERIAVVDRNVAMLVQMLNAQDEMLIKVQKRQRIWNFVLAGGILVAIGLALLV